MANNIFSFLTAIKTKTAYKSIALSRCSLVFFMISMSLFVSVDTQAQQASANTIVLPPVNANFRQHIANGRVTVNVTSPGTSFLIGYGRIKIERISPSPFTIEPNDNYLPSMYFQLNTPNYMVTTMQILDAIGNMAPANLKSTGISLASITSNGNIVLPEGTYRLCFTVLNDDYYPISLAGTGCATFTIAPTQPPNVVTVNTLLIPPAKPDVLQMISTGAVKPTILYNNPAAQNIQVKVFGKIESLSPKPFSISISPEYNQQQPVNLTNGQPVQLNSSQVMDAFANFNESFLVLNGISLGELKDANNNIKLPEGNYRICFYTRYFTTAGLGPNASNPNLGCGSFSICYKAAPPQFTQPVSNFNIQGTIAPIRPASPVIFTWTPPNATCGLNLSTINYDFEIREMMESQTVTDAINNPPVFIKQMLPSSTFLLDTMLNKQVLQRGKRYVVRVKANTPLNSPIEIDNNGYSRVQAFVYGDDLPVELPPVRKPVVRTSETPSLSTITTSTIKGKAVWSFKKGEEEFVSRTPLRTETMTIMNLPTVNIPGNLRVEQSKIAIDPNYRYTSLKDQKAIGTISSTISPGISSPVIKADAGKFIQSDASKGKIDPTISGDGELIEKTDANISAEKGKILHPLSGARVLLRGIKANESEGTIPLRVTGPVTPVVSTVNLSTQLALVNPDLYTVSGQTNANKVVATVHPSFLIKEKNKQEDDLIGSGTTDAAGNFVIHFIDPKYRNITSYSKMQIVIDHPDFERVEKTMDVKSPDENGNLDLGEVHLLAKTYRFTPYIDGMNNSENVTVELFTSVSSTRQNPHFAFMSNNPGSGSEMIAGKEYRKIASVQNGQTINKLFYQKGSNENYIVKISGKNKVDYVTYLGVVPSKYGAIQSNAGKPVESDESSKVISVKKKYILKSRFPFAVGNVKSASDGIVPISNAIVKVTYASSDVEEEYTAPKLSAESKPVTTASTRNVGKDQTPGIKTSIPTAKSSQNTPGSGSSKRSKHKLALLPTKYVATTDEDGNYRIENLPVLKSGAKFTISVSASSPQIKDEQFVLGRNRGDSLVANFDVKAEKYTITGIVVDAQGNPLENAQLKWMKAGGSIIDAAASGLFTTTSIFATDSLIISRPGYVAKTVFVDIKEAAKSAKAANTTKSNKTKTNTAGSQAVAAGMDIKVSSWVTTLSSQPSVQLATTKSTASAASNFGYMTASLPSSQMTTGSNTLIAQLQPVYADLFKESESNTGFKDLGKVGYLEKGSAKIKFVVKDLKTKASVTGAVITIENTLDTVTNNTGEVTFKGGGESFTYSVKGPEGSKYINYEGEVDFPQTDGSTTTVSILLEQGVKISGKVTSKGTDLADAEIFVEGKSFISTNSKSDGTYELYVPAGENTLKATKMKYYGKEVVKNFGKDEKVDFDLQDGGGKNISSLLGFDIELEAHTPDGAGEKWTGSFIKLKSNTAFTVSERLKIKFTDVKVTFDAEGNAIVEGNEVKTDLTELPLKVFGYVPVKILGDPQIVVKKRVDGKGVIGGKIQLDIDQISSLGGVLFDHTIKTLLVPLNTPIDQEVPIFTHDGSLPVSLEFGIAYAKDEAKKASEKLKAELQKKIDKAKDEAKAVLQAKLDELKNSMYASIKVYDFDALLDLAKSKITAAGMDLKGAIITPDLPVISSIPVEIENFKLGSDFSIQSLSVKADVNYKFNIASWSAELNSVGFDMNGFKIGGKVNVAIPKSPVTGLDFTNLGIGLKNIYGGNFTLPKDGLDVFEIIKLKAGSTPINFGEIGNSGVYKIGGAAKFAFEKLFTETFEVPYFQVQTDGKFAITVPVDKSLDAGFAKFELQSIGFDASRNTPQIDVNGKFDVGTDLITFTAGDIHFKKSGYTVDKIGIGLNIPAVDVKGFVDLKENGFAGAAALSIAGTPITADVEFHYFNKKGGGVDLGASFAAGVYIPIGVVGISKVGGGFSYQTDRKKFFVNITGAASITGFDAAVSMDPINVSVKNGPVIEGEVNLKVTDLNVAKAGIIIDLANSYFSVDVKATMEPIPDVTKATVSGLFVLSAKKDDTYFFLGCDMKVQMAGLINSQGKFAFGAGVKNAKTRPGISAYTQEIPDSYLKNGAFSGIYLNAEASMGKRKREAYEFDMMVISAKFWLFSETRFNFISNFNNGDFRLTAGINLNGGVEIGLLGFANVSAAANACALVSGGFDNSRGWNFTASANGYGEIGIGRNCGCNSICFEWVVVPVGGKVCVGAGADIEYSSRQGGLKKFELRRGNTQKCF